jgi:TPR repeat protein
MPATGELQVAKALSLYEQAWKDGVAVAAFNLGRLYEHGVIGDGKQHEPLLVADADKALYWYESGLRANEPNALAYFAERASRSALSESDASGRDARLLESFKYYTAAVERARREDWPDITWKSWRYRRASIARLLARDGMAEQVAQVYRSARGGVR